MFLFPIKVKRPRKHSPPVELDYKLHTPGACHKTRFMAQSLYLLKIALLSDEFNHTQREKNAVKIMADFIALFYAQFFLQARLSSMQTCQFKISKILRITPKNPEIS